MSLACPLFVRRPSQLSPAFASRTCRRDGMCILCAFALDMKNRVSSHNFVCTGTCVCVCVPTARRFHYCLALLWRQTGPLRTRLDDAGTVATGCPVYSILYSIFILTSLNCQLMIQIVSERDQQTHAKKKQIPLLSTIGVFAGALGLLLCHALPSQLHQLRLSERRRVWVDFLGKSLRRKMKP